MATCTVDVSNASCASYLFLAKDKLSIFLSVQKGVTKTTRRMAGKHSITKKGNRHKKSFSKKLEDLGTKQKLPFLPFQQTFQVKTFPSVDTRLTLDKNKLGPFLHLF